MPPITALLHTENDALRLGRALETLYPCDDILVVDHDSHDSTVQLAREYGACVVEAVAGAAPDHYFRHVGPGWIFCLDPRESLTESLAASLYEWKLAHARDPAATTFSVFLREETPEGWVAIPTPETRLVTPDWSRWQEKLPANDPSAVVLEGTLLRFAFP
jgi:glycosyltransferase involved in cell wall biosynthesis